MLSSSSATAQMQRKTLTYQHTRPFADADAEDKG